MDTSQARRTLASGAGLSLSSALGGDATDRGTATACPRPLWSRHFRLFPPKPPLKRRAVPGFRGCRSRRASARGDPLKNSKSLRTTSNRSKRHQAIHEIMGSLQEYPRRDGIAASTVYRQRSTAMGYHFREADIEPLLLMIADQMHGSSRRNDDPARRTPAIVDLISNMAALARLSGEPAGTKLRA